MAFRSLILVTLAAISLAACGQGQAEEPDPLVAGTYRFEEETSPAVVKWNNGVLFATCPAGFHFEPMSSWRGQQRMECKVNPAPSDGE